MKINEVLSEDVLQKHDIGFGLTQFEGKEYSLVGGSRSGSSPSGLTRLKYDIIDHAMHDKTGDMNKSKMGHVELFVADSTGKIDGLVNIEITNKKAGWALK